LLSNAAGTTELIRTTAQAIEAYSQLPAIQYAVGSAQQAAQADGPLIGCLLGAAIVTVGVVVADIYAIYEFVQVKGRQDESGKQLTLIEERLKKSLPYGYSIQKGMIYGPNGKPTTIQEAAAFKQQQEKQLTDLGYNINNKDKLPGPPVSLGKDSIWYDMNNKPTYDPPVTGGAYPLSKMRQMHIIWGNVPQQGGGGHTYKALIADPTLIANKTEHGIFPSTIADVEIIIGTYLIANRSENILQGENYRNPSTATRFRAFGYINNTFTRVIIEPYGQGIITAHPEYGINLAGGN